MNIRIFLPLCVVCALLLVACAKPESTTNRDSTTPAATSANPIQPPLVTRTSGEKIGVPECDAFLAAYEDCVFSKAPEATRANYKAAIEHWRFTWKKLAANPTTKATLAQQCKQAIEQAKVSSVKDFNCNF